MCSLVYDYKGFDEAKYHVGNDGTFHSFTGLVFKLFFGTINHSNFHIEMAC